MFSLGPGAARPELDYQFIISIGHVQDSSDGMAQSKLLHCVVAEDLGNAGQWLESYCGIEAQLSSPIARSVAIGISMIHTTHKLVRVYFAMLRL